MSTATESRVAVADRVPARVRRPDGELIDTDCRVVLTATEVYVFTDRDGGVQLDHRGSYDRARSETAPRRTWRIVTPAGNWTVERGRGCGCGPLRRYVPWLPYRLVHT